MALPFSFTFFMCRQQDLFGLFKRLYPFMATFICISGDPLFLHVLRFFVLESSVLTKHFFFFHFGLRRHPVAVVDAVTLAMPRRRKFLNIQM